MKKTLSLLCAACIAVGMQAQTYMVNDFESGLNGANAAWGGTAELIDNPCSSSDNSSTKVLKVVSTEFANVAIPLNLPEGKTLADYTGVRLQLAVLEGSENITWVGNELGLVDNDTQEKTFQVAQNSWGDATYNTWMSLDFNFDETILATYLDGNHASTSLLIKVGRQAFNYAIDNIRLIEKEQVADPNTIFTFETMDLGATPRCGMPWSGSCEVAENPYTTGINTSSKALKANVLPLRLQRLFLLVKRGMIILESSCKSAFWKVASSGVLLRWVFVPMVAHTSSLVIRLMQVPDKKALVSAIILRASGWT